MKKILKISFGIVGILTLIFIAALAYLNFVYLPQKVKSVGAAYLEEKSKGQVKAVSIQYIPFKGVKLKNITILSRAKEPLITLDKLYLNVNLWPLIIRRELDFRLALYPAKREKPFIFNGFYQIKQQKLNLDFKVKTNFFIQQQTIIGQLNALIDKEEEINIDLNLASHDLNVQGNFYIKDKDLRIEKLSGKLLQSGFDFIGDVQNLSEPLLNIYGNLDLELESLKNLRPKYSQMFNKLNMTGRLAGKIYIAQQAKNPEVGLKMNARQIRIKGAKIENLSLISKMENKKVSVTKFYAKLYGGEVNLQGTVKLKSKTNPANLNLNIFNLDLNRIVKDITGKDIPVGGRLFSLARLNAHLQQPKDVQGKVWLSVAGSNMLQLPLFKGIADILRLPELRQVEFKEASGNFTVAKQEIRTDDFKIVSNNIAISFKGYMDFAGNLGFDIEPSFSQNFLLSAPNISNILGIFIDSTGSFLGEIKLKGNIKNPRYTFKPISVDKLFPRGIEQGLKELFEKFKKKEEQNQ